MRLDEWQKYLEGEFLDEPDDEPAADPASAVRTPPAISSSSSKQLQEDGRSDPDSWIPAKSTFVGSNILLTGGVSVLTPLSSKYRDKDIADKSDKVSPTPECASRTVRRSQTSRRIRTSRDIPDKAATSAQVTTQGPAISIPGEEIPRHVRLLLELGNRERLQGQEVAQSSYKRPFQETRQELIARLLDPELSLEEAARLLNVCPTTVRRYTKRGLLNYYRKETDRTNKTGQKELSEPPESGDTNDRETRQRRFRLSDILAFLEPQECAQVES